jgi:limonene-1,2-epoxide hydrolase
MTTIAADVASSNLRVVEGFLESWKTVDPSKILAHVTDDLVYHDMPFAARQGVADFERRLKWFLSYFTECELVVNTAAVSTDGVVMLERVDRFKVNDNWLEMPVASVAVVRDGKVAEWREYYDAETAEREMTRCLGESFRIDLRDE